MEETRGQERRGEAFGERLRGVVRTRGPTDAIVVLFEEQRELCDFNESVVQERVMVACGS